MLTPTFRSCCRDFCVYIRMYYTVIIIIIIIIIILRLSYKELGKYRFRVR